VNPEWFEDESFWVETYPFLFREERMSAAAEEVEKAMALTGVKGGAVLDLCCGPGRHAVELARLGFRVTGVDRTPFLLEKARAGARENKVDVEWVQQDMRRFAREDAFDLVLNMFTSFGYFDEEEESVTVLGNIFRSLRRGGKFLLDVKGKEAMARVLTRPLVDELPDGSLLVERPRVMDNWTRLENEWIVIKGDQVKRFTIRLFAYSARELQELLERVGFVDIRLFGDLEGKPYGIDSRRLIAVCGKP
jgi:SAM-dependent methyltransferase